MAVRCIMVSHVLYFLDFSKALDTIEHATLIKKVSFTTLEMLLLA